MPSDKLTTWPVPYNARFESVLGGQFLKFFEKIFRLHILEYNKGNCIREDWLTVTTNFIFEIIII